MVNTVDDDDDNVASFLAGVSRDVPDCVLLRQSRSRSVGRSNGRSVINVP